MFSYIIGGLIGSAITIMIFCMTFKKLGTLEVNETDPEEVKIKFVFTKDVDFSKDRFVVFDIKYGGEETITSRK